MTGILAGILGSINNVILCIYCSAWLLWIATGFLAKAGWIKPTGITWFDAAVSRAEHSVWDAWLYTGQWVARAGLIIVLCFSAALSLFVVLRIFVTF